MYRLAEDKTSSPCGVAQALAGDWALWSSSLQPAPSVGVDCTESLRYSSSLSFNQVKEFRNSVLLAASLRFSSLVMVTRAVSLFGNRNNPSSRMFFWETLICTWQMDTWHCFPLNTFAACMFGDTVPGRLVHCIDYARRIVMKTEKRPWWGWIVLCLGAV